MASIDFSITKRDGSKVGRSFSASDDDVGRIITWALATLPDEMDDKGNPLSRSVDWAIGRLLEGFVAETLANVMSYEQRLAAEAASSAVKPITLK